MKLVGCRGVGGGGRPSPVLKNCCWSFWRRSVRTSWGTVAPWEDLPASAEAELLDWGGTESEEGAGSPGNQVRLLVTCSLVG